MNWISSGYYFCLQPLHLKYIKNTPKIAPHSGSEKIFISWAIKFYKNLVAFYPHIDIIDLIFNLELTNFVFTKKF